MPNLWIIFTTGLLTGGLTCLAVQGGLLAATLATKATKDNNALPILSFLGAKLIVYTVLGMLLGLLGSFFQISITARALLQVIIAIFMIGTAANLLNIAPIFRYFVIQPPRFLTNLIRNQSKSKDFFAPAVVGAFTVFIPCGTTQAMMALAIASGSPLSGALILFVFILGTSPIFFALGYLATRLGEALHAQFMKLAAVTIMMLAVFNLNNAMALAGSNFTVEAAWKNVFCTVTFCTDDPTLLHDVAVNQATIEIGPRGYTPNGLTVKAGSNVTIRLVNNGGRGCIQAFTIPGLGIQRVVRDGTTETIAFTAPSTPGQLAFMCSMGMFRGVINVI